MTDTPATRSEDMDAWTMSTSVYIGLHQAISKAREEREHLIAGAEGNPFAKGMRPNAMLIEALIEAERNLSADLRSIARSSHLQMPKVRE